MSNVVTRYKIHNGMLVVRSVQTWDVFNQKYLDIVLASDYDVLEAELARVTACDDIADLYERAEKAEARVQALTQERDAIAAEYAKREHDVQVLWAHTKALEAAQNQQLPAPYFVGYLMENYPTGCVISDIAWHAPKLWRAAMYALKQATQSAPASQPQADQSGGTK